MDNMEYARCIDCMYFGNHGAHCDIQGQVAQCVSKACCFFNWKKPQDLREMDPIYFYPNFEENRREMLLRGMEAR